MLRVTNPKDARFEDCFKKKLNTSKTNANLCNLDFFHPLKFENANK